MLLPHRDRMVQVTQAACFGSSERFLGLLASTFGDVDAAVEHFEGALHKNAERGVLPLIPFIRVEFAQVLLAAERPEPARALLEQALREAEAAGISQLVARVRPMLSGQTPVNR
jgi:hypothetical protein